MKLPIDHAYIEKFSERGKTFAKVYGSPVHYKKNGNWKHIDEFKLKKTDEIEGVSDDFPVKIKGFRIKAGKDRWEIDGLYLDGKLLEKPSGEPTYSGNEVTWENIFSNIDLKLEISPYKVRELFIIKKNPLVDGKRLSIKYKITGKPKLKKAFGYDKQNRTFRVDYENGEKSLDTRVLSTYQYPLTIDPTTSPNSSADSWVSRNVGSGVYSAIQNTVTIHVGSYTDGKGSWEYRRGYLRFDLSSMSSYTINTATLYLYSAGTVYAMNVNQSSGEVDPETGTASTIYSNAAGTNITSTSAVSNGWRTATVTTHASNHKGGYCDIGLVGPESTGGGTQLSIWNSSEAVANNPYLYIDYTEGGGGTAVKDIIRMGFIPFAR